MDRRDKNSMGKALGHTKDKAKGKAKGHIKEKERPAWLEIFVTI